MASKSPIFTSIYRKHEMICKTNTIPSRDMPLLEKRLFIACTVFKAAAPIPGGRENKELLAQSRERKAQMVYQEVLETCPDIFLAFLLTVSPRCTIKFDLPTFYEQHRARPIALCEETKSGLFQIAKRRGFENSDPFRLLIGPMTYWRRPSTEDEGEEHFSLSLSGLPAIRIAFGDVICDAVESSPTHLPKSTDGGYAETTECVRSKIFYNRQDTAICLDVGCAFKLADMLFPFASQKILSALSQSHSDYQASGSQAALPPHTQTSSLDSDIDFAYFTLRGASVYGIQSAFGAAIREGIDNSELRRWEKYHHISEVTDCVIMHIWRAQPHRGLIKLRLGHYTGVNLANKIYAGPSSTTIEASISFNTS
ncbi:hypothetical protein N7475_003554 [Penicillium sp. IBT 31633x]|nr:hypothetical protein N7475_003554 [Penicillium sp. IBT 31633x]